VSSGVIAAVSCVACALAFGGCSRALQPESQSQPAVEPLPAATRGASAAPGSTAASTSVAQPSVSQPDEGVVVVELFTSEGCSSCPPADRVLSRIAARARSQSLPVYTLSFHVDYWNYLGWADRFSSSSYSDRQRGYASINPSGGTYTPQAVINGQSECVGSNASSIDSLIGAALKRQSRTKIALDAHRSDDGIALGYRVSGDTAGRVLNLALVEPHAESAVKSGENAGERLSHVNVVRAFESRPLAAGVVGTWTFKPAGDFGAQRVGIVAYAEDTTQRDISGAAALEIAE
jgi:hypothetical protein